MWGTTYAIPKFSFVLEVIEPGLLVVKYRRGQDPGKFVNVLVLKGDQIKVVDEEGTSLPDCPDLLSSLLGFGLPDSQVDSINVLVQLAVSMRAHGRGGHCWLCRRALSSMAGIYSAAHFVFSGASIL
ncbi:MAG: hypothetical protein WKF84_01650 [Pyrinomonadaceae bacterium]